MIVPRESKDYFGKSNKYVKELTPVDFSSYQPSTIIKSKNTKGNGLMMFYAPWCPHCKDLAPIWEAAAKISGFCDFYAFNCEKYKGHVLKIQESTPNLIQGYPSVIIYKNGEPFEVYDGGRSVKELLDVCMHNSSR